MDVGLGGQSNGQESTMRFFSAARPQPSTLTAISSGLRELYTVPNDVPESFVKVFARLDSARSKAQPSTRKSGSSLGSESDVAS